jgi:hypothetical protein
MNIACRAQPIDFDLPLAALLFERVEGRDIERATTTREIASVAERSSFGSIISSLAGARAPRLS